MASSSAFKIQLFFEKMFTKTFSMNTGTNKIRQIYIFSFSSQLGPFSPAAHRITAHQHTSHWLVSFLCFIFPPPSLVLPEIIFHINPTHQILLGDLSKDNFLTTEVTTSTALVARVQCLSSGPLLLLLPFDLLLYPPLSILLCATVVASL